MSTLSGGSPATKTYDGCLTGEEGTLGVPFPGLAPWEEAHSDGATVHLPTATAATTEDYGDGYA